MKAESISIAGAGEKWQLGLFVINNINMTEGDYNALKQHFMGGTQT